MSDYKDYLEEMFSTLDINKLGFSKNLNLPNYLLGPFEPILTLF